MQFLLDLDMQNSVSTPKVDLGWRKATSLPPAPSKRFFVNQFYARPGSLVKLAFDIIRRESNMMDSARRIFLKIFRNGTFRAGWLKEFEMNFANGKKRRADFLRGNFFAAVAFEAERLFIVRHGFVQ